MPDLWERAAQTRGWLDIDGDVDPEWTARRAARPKPPRPGPRRQFTAAMRDEAARRVASGESPAVIAWDLGTTDTSVKRWAKERQTCR